MKRLLKTTSLLALMLLSTTGILQAATVSGTIYSTGGVYGAPAVPAAGATVWIYYNLNGTVFVSTTTNSAGNYSITIPGAWAGGSGNLINVHDTASAGGCTGSKQYSYTGANIVHNDTMCNYTWYTIGGKVRLQSGAPAANAKVWFITEEIDTAGGVAATVLRAKDSTVTNSSGDYVIAKTGYWILSNQRVKAALQPGDPNYSNYLPTYHDSALNWSAATLFGSSAWTGNVRNLNISLRGGVNPGGPGFISGDVLLGANKTTAVGDPLQSRIILLTTAAGKAVTYVYSNASGHFSFSNLPYGTYNLFGDATGKANPALTVTISAANPSQTNIVFEENNSKFEGHVKSLGVGTRSPLEAVDVFPNPINAYVEVNALQGISGGKTAILRSITGSVVSTTYIEAGTPSARIQTNDISAGVYILELQTAAGSSQYRLLKK